MNQNPFLTFFSPPLFAFLSPLLFILSLRVHNSTKHTIAQQLICRWPFNSSTTQICTDQNIIHSNGIFTCVPKMYFSFKMFESVCMTNNHASMAPGILYYSKSPQAGEKKISTSVHFTYTTVFYGCIYICIQFTSGLCF